MLSKMNNFQNKKQLNSFMEKGINRFQDGEVAYLIDENKMVVYNGKEWTEVVASNVNEEGLSMSLYDLNKSVITQLPVLNDLNPCLEVIRDFHNNNINGKYYMLLCKDISYYTIFIKDTLVMNEFNNIEEAVLACAQDIGGIVSVEKTPEETVEIWVKTKDGEALCMYLFDCAGLIVKWG